MSDPAAEPQRYLNSVLLEGRVEETSDALEGDPCFEIALAYPKIRIDATQFMHEHPEADPVLWGEVRIIGELKDDGEQPYLLVRHIERRLPR